ncbi:MAG: hypothetical protein ACOX50_03765 [Patescibacteria group bacterium]
MVVSSTDIVGASRGSPVGGDSDNNTRVDQRSTPTEQEIINLLQTEPLTLDEIALKLNKTIIELGQILTMLALKEVIHESNGKYYSKTAGAI